MSFIRTVISYIVLFIASFMGASLCVLGGIFNPYSRFNTTVIKCWASSIMWVAGAKLRVEGLENLPKESNAIYAANHMSSFDIMAMVKAVPETARFIAK